MNNVYIYIYNNNNNNNNNTIRINSKPIKFVYLGEVSEKLLLS